MDRNNASTYTRNAAMRVIRYPRHILGSLASDEAFLIAQTAFFTHYKDYDIGEAIYDFYASSHESKTPSDVQEVSSILSEDRWNCNVVDGHLESIVLIKCMAEMVFWDATLDEKTQLLLAERHKNDFDAHVKLLIMVADKPSYLPYAEQGIVDENFIARCIAEGVDSSLAVQLALVS